MPPYYQVQGVVPPAGGVLAYKAVAKLVHK